MTSCESRTVCLNGNYYEIPPGSGIEIRGGEVVVNGVPAKPVEDMPQLSVNGKSFEVPAGSSVSIVDGEVYVDDQIVKTNKEVREALKSAVEIEWKGDLVSLLTDKNVKCGNVGNSVAAGGQVDCIDVNGDVEAGGTVWAHEIKGSVVASGVNHRTPSTYQRGYSDDDGYHQMYFRG